MSKACWKDVAHSLLLPPATFLNTASAYMHSQHIILAVGETLASMLVMEPFLNARGLLGFWHRLFFFFWPLPGGTSTNGTCADLCQLACVLNFNGAPQNALMAFKKQTATQHHVPWASLAALFQHFLRGTVQCACLSLSEAAATCAEGANLQGELTGQDWTVANRVVPTKFSWEDKTSKLFFRGNKYCPHLVRVRIQCGRNWTKSVCLEGSLQAVRPASGETQREMRSIVQAFFKDAMHAVLPTPIGFPKEMR
eukprot:1143665-Pelagomonas_calceolata.AAC.4